MILHGPRLGSRRAHTAVGRAAISLQAALLHLNSKLIRCIQSNGIAYKVEWPAGRTGEVIRAEVIREVIRPRTARRTAAGSGGTNRPSASCRSGRPRGCRCAHCFPSVLLSTPPLFFRHTTLYTKYTEEFEPTLITLGHDRVFRVEGWFSSSTVDMLSSATIQPAVQCKTA